MSWDNFDADTNEHEEQNKEPKKLIGSVDLMDTLSDRSRELTSKLLSDIDNETGLVKQIINLNITEVNKSTSKETRYKTEEDKTDAYMNKVLNHDNEDLLKSVTNFAVSSERKKRYDLYEQVYDSNYIAARIMQAYLNNTLIKNAQTKNFLTIKTPQEKEALLNYLGRDVRNSYEKFNKSILIKYKIQRKLKDTIVPKTLLFGNYFAEVIDLNYLNNIAQHEQILMESSTDNKSFEVKEQKKPDGPYDFIFESNFDCFKNEDELKKEIQDNKDELFEEVNAYSERNKAYKEKLNKVLEESNYENVYDGYQEITESEFETPEDKLKALQEFSEKLPKRPTNPKGLDTILEEAILENGVDTFDSGFFDGILTANKSKKKTYNIDDIHELDFSCLKDIFLTFHHPKNVIIIEKDSLIYGYLIVEEDLGSGQGGEYVVDRYKRFSSGLNSSAGEKQSAEENVNEITDKLTEEIMKKVVHNIRLSKKRAYSSDFDYFKTLNLSDEATTSLKLLIYNKIKKKSKLKFRFLTPETCINFNTGINKFAPYGTSVFDPIVGPVKMYTLALMSSVVSRLSRAAVIRKWTIETGEKRNHKEIVEKTKAELKSKSITYDKINSLKNISEIVTDFRDMATITINGNRYIDMEILPMQDRGLPLNDLNDLKQDIVAAGGVPPIYLNMGDTIDLRETLVHLNITFANDIIDKQQSIEDGINSLNDCLFKKVLKYNGYEDADFYISNYSEIKLNPPLVLQIQSDEAMITTVSNIISMLEQTKLQIDPKSMLEKYIPTINWSQLEEEGQQYLRKLGKKAIASGEDPMGGNPY